VVDEKKETNARIALTGIMNTMHTLPRIPLNIICVVDCSDSMTGVKMAKAKQAVLTIFETIQPGDRCTVLSFASSA
jgi:Mg-chelatase subunit ChlD